MSLLADLDRWIAPLGGALLHFLWQGALLALVAWAAMTLARSPRVRYAIGCGAMLLMLACPPATVLWIGPEAPRVVAPTAPAPTVVAPPPRLAGELARREARPTTPPTPIPAPTLRERLAPHASTFVAIWLIGVGVVATYHLVGLARIARLRRASAPILDPAWQARVGALADRLGLRRAVALCATTRLDCPAVVGAIRPVILWPAAALTGLTPTQVDALLAHELAHVARHDYLVNLLQAVVETLLFYHPAVWWLSRRIRATREHCCDDLAAQVVGDRLTYAGALAAMESLRAAPALAVGARGGALLDRVQRLVGAPTAVRRSPAAGRGAMLALLAVTIAIATWSARAGDDAAADAALSIRAGDRLSVLFEYRPGDKPVAQLLDVDTSGRIELLPPHVGGPLPATRAITVVGLTPDAAARAIDGQISGRRGTVVRIARRAATTRAVATRPTAAYRIGPGDRVRAVATGLDGTANEAVESGIVGPDGTVALGLLGRRVTVAGRTADEIGDALAQRLARDGRAPDARVTFEVTAVARGWGHYRILAERDLAMAQLLARRERLDTRLRADAQPARASGIYEPLAALDRQIADRSVALAHEPEARNDSELAKRYRALQAERASAVALAAPLSPRDRLDRIDAELGELIRGTGEYYVGGHVARPGVYSLNGRRITVKQALAAAGLLDDAALPRDAAGEAWIDAVLRAVASPEKPTEATLRLALADVLAGRHDDVTLLPNDHLMVGIAVAATTQAATQPASATSTYEATAGLDGQLRLRATDGAQTEAVAERLTIQQAPPTTAPQAARIAPRDTVQVALVARAAAGEDGLADVRVKDVAADGTISVAGIGRVAIAGRTDGEAAVAIAAGLRAAGRAEVASVGVKTVRRADDAGAAVDGAPSRTESVWVRVPAASTAPADPRAVVDDVLRASLGDGAGKQAEEKRVAASAPPATAPAEYRLVANDLLRVEVSDPRAGLDLKVLKRVSGGGLISLPYVEAVKVGGLSEIEAERAIARAYRDQQVAERPVVGVLAVQRSDGVNVPGELLGGRADADAVAPARPASMPADDRIAAGDVVRMTVYELAGPGKPAIVMKRVGGDGAVTLPYLKEPLKLAGLTPAEAERAIVRAYGAAQVIANGQADVLVVQPANGRAAIDTADGAAEAQQARIDALTAELAALKAAVTKPTNATPATTRAAAAEPDVEQRLAAADPFFRRLVQTRDEIVVELARLEALHGPGAAAVIKMRTNLQALNARIAQIRDAMSRQTADDEALLARLVGRRDALAVELDLRRGSLGPNAAEVVKKQADLAALDGAIEERRAKLAGSGTARDPMRSATRPASE